jgi:pyrroline-5-carboxylate reductase
LGKKNILIIGSGHLGRALAQGLIRKGILPSDITLASPNVHKKKRLKKIGANLSTEIVKETWVFIAVKPQDAPLILKQISQSLKKQIVVSTVAGLNTETLKKLLPTSHVTRIMPNLPIAIGEGVIGYFKGSLTKNESLQLTQLLQKLGSVIPVSSEEKLVDLTLLSGCGTGVVAYFINLLEQESLRRGLNEKEACQIALNVFKGTTNYMEQNKVSPKELTQQVATKGGVTEIILETLDKNHLSKIFSKAIKKGEKKVKL